MERLTDEVADCSRARRPRPNVLARGYCVERRRSRSPPVPHVAATASEKVGGLRNNPCPPSGVTTLTTLSETSPRIGQAATLEAEAEATEPGIRRTYHSAAQSIGSPRRQRGNSRPDCLRKRSPREAHVPLGNVEKGRPIRDMSSSRRHRCHMLGRAGQRRREDTPRQADRPEPRPARARSRISPSTGPRRSARAWPVVFENRTLVTEKALVSGRHPPLERIGRSRRSARPRSRRPGPYPSPLPSDGSTREPRRWPSGSDQRRAGYPRAAEAAFGMRYRKVR